MNLDPTVQVAAVTGAFGLLTLLLEGLRRQNKKLGKVAEHSEAARHQVQNSHTTNLRDDVDRVLDRLDEVLAGQTRHDKAIDGLRRDLGHEREERLAVSERLDHHIERNQ